VKERDSHQDLHYIERDFLSINNRHHHWTPFSFMNHPKHPLPLLSLSQLLIILLSIHINYHLLLHSTCNQLQLCNCSRDLVSSMLPNEMESVEPSTVVINIVF
jgi:hypothetical protein